MKLHLFFLSTYLGVAAVSAIAVAGATFFTEPWVLATATAVSILTALIVGVFATWRLRRGLAIVDNVIADYQQADQQTGLEEVDQLVRRIAGCAQHWETIAVATRDQAGEFQAIMARLDRRGERRGHVEMTAQQFRGALTGLGHTMHGYLTQIERGAVEIDEFSRSITEGAESQGHALIKTTTYLEQLSTAIETVASTASTAKSTLERTGECAKTALSMVNELSQGVKRVQAETLSCEKKLQGLCDPASQINAIVDTISDIAARTNLLALNASIESIRAGEHGRGFALVADEVRSLAEQATAATREISSLMDSVQLATQESIRGISREREHIEEEVVRARNAEEALRTIVELGKDTRAIELIAESTGKQLILAQDVVMAVEQISSLAKSNRGNAESVAWTMKSLINANPDLRRVVDRLKNSPAEEAPREETRSVTPVVVSSSASSAELAPVG